MEDPPLVGTIYSGSTGMPLSAAVVRCGAYNQKTDYRGNFRLKLTHDEPILIIHPKFHTQTIKQSDLDLSKTFETYLTPSAWAQSEVVENKHVEWVDRPSYGSITDYTFLDDTLLIFSVIKSTKGGLNKKSVTEYSEIRLHHRGIETGRYQFREPIKSMHHAVDDIVYLIGDSLAWQFSPNKKPNGLRSIEIKDYNDLVRYSFYCDSQSLFYLYPALYIPQVAFVQVNRNNNPPEILRFVRSPSYFAQIESDYTMLTPMQYQLTEEMSSETGYSPKVYAPLVRSREIYRDIHLPNVAAYRQNGDLYVFDHRNDWLFKHDLNGIAIDSVRIYHNHLQREDLVQVIQDPFDESLYTVHDRGGAIVIRSLNTQNGATGKPFKLHFPFAQKVKIFEKYAYYLYQPIEKGSYIQLVREPIPSSIKN